MELTPAICYPFQMDRERYRNPPAPLGYQNLNPPDIVRRATEDFEIEFQEWITVGIFEDEDVTIYDHFVINSDSEDEDVPTSDRFIINSDSKDVVQVPVEPIVKNVESVCLSDGKIETVPLDNIKKEKEDIKTETEDVENTEQRIYLSRGKEVKTTEPLAGNDDVEKKEVTEMTDLRIKATKVKPSELNSKTAVDVIEKRTDDYREKASAKHRKRKREDEGNRHKRIKIKTEISDSDDSSRKKKWRRTRDGDCDSEIEEKRHRRKVKKYHSLSPTGDYYEEDNKKDIKKDFKVEWDDRGYPATSIKQEDSDDSSRKKKRRHTRDGDSDSKKEEKRHKRKVKKYHSPSPTGDNYEEDYKKDIKKDYDVCVYPATSIKQEFPSIHGKHYCEICHLSLNSQTTYQSHIIGKRHRKNLDAKNVAQAVAKTVVSAKNLDAKNIAQAVAKTYVPVPTKPAIKCPNPADFSELFKLYSQPDPSKAGFYCNLCNSHSNSSPMWEAHINGKRHIANIKKAPGTAPSKCKNFPAPPGTVARLHSQLKDVYEPIVGLDQIREIQDIDIVTYTCFLCGGIAICEDEIVDHILLMKHREKYLEKIGHPELKTLHNCQMSVRGSVIAELCEEVEVEQGSGKPEVFYTKNSLLRM